MKRIAFVINYIVKSGPSSVVLNIIENLNQCEYEITLITLFQGNDKTIIERLHGEGVCTLECHALSRAGCILGKDDEFKRIISKQNFDIIHTHGFIPDILSSRLHIKAKRITTIHNNMFEDYLDSYGLFKSKALIPMHLHALKKLDECACCSKSVYDAMVPYLLKACYIRNGIGSTAPTHTVTRKDISIPETARVYIFAGQLNTGKNIVWLITNFVKYHLDDEYLIVLGQGEMAEQCEQVADDHVRMMGFQKDPIAFYKISDVYVSASKSEGFSISVLEALDNGLGLLLSDIPSHREIIEIGENVYLGELFESSTLEKGFAKIRGHKIDKNAITCFKSRNLSAECMVREYSRIYRL